MNRNLNDELGLMGSILQKMRIELFDLQHIKVDPAIRNTMLDLQKELITLSSKFHREYDFIKEFYKEQLPEPIPYDAPKPLSTSAEALTRLRKFDGNESVNQQLDFFEGEHNNTNTG